jgi:hypothetical protein
MGLVLDSSVIISAERRGDNVTLMLKQFRATTGISTRSFQRLDSPN